ncbi:MAG: hypothetical protein H6818_07790 [Phycisphaerales bacterium]|nr:hypothetical protein [Phycisphaerales bacterium]
MLPDDLIKYLSVPENRSITLNEGEIRTLTFHAHDSIPKRKFDIDSYGLVCSGHLNEDPDERREFDGYDLIESCNDYEPEGILVWFPEWRRYGSWDCDHHVITTYPDVTWTQIIAAPTWYVNGQWYPENVNNEMMNPWA